MAIAKEKMKGVIESQPDDATYKEILRELTFERMVGTWSCGFPRRPCAIKWENGAPYSLVAELRWTNEAETWLKDIWLFSGRE